MGFKLAGLEPVFALDNDSDAAATFLANMPKVYYDSTEIGQFSVKALKSSFRMARGHPRLFCGCAPCQPFTKQRTEPKDNDARRYLLGKFAELVGRFEPELVFVENVPGMQNVQGKGGPFDAFLRTLDVHKYHVAHSIVRSQDYGVPQMRRRLVLIASRFGPINFPPKTHGPNTQNPHYSCVRDWIPDLPRIEAGQADAKDPCHRAASLSETNLKRIRALKEGEDRRAWTDDLKLACHSKGHKGHTDVYGRMSWTKQASCLTTRCISLSNGRFGHPEQDRAISVREAALLQTFPSGYQFKGGPTSMARQIGNAVPVVLAQRFGEHFIAHVLAHVEEGL